MLNGPTHTWILSIKLTIKLTSWKGLIKVKHVLQYRSKYDSAYYTLSWYLWLGVWLGLGDLCDLFVQ